MNCKQGNWAVLVRSHANNVGVVVKCVRPFGRSVESFAERGPRWVIDRPLKDSLGEDIHSVADSCLLPLKTAAGNDLKLLRPEVADLVELDA